MKIRKDLSVAVVSLGACLLASQVHAFAFTDASMQDAMGVFSSPSALQYGKGKPRKESINALTGLFAGDAWSLLDRTNKPSQSFDDVLFLLSANTGRRSGVWELDWDKPDFSPSMDFILLLKAGKQWGAYLFQAGGIGPAAQTLGGNFEISWVNKKGKTPKLRYASIYGRHADIPTSEPDISPVEPDTSAVDTDPTAVEPDNSVVDTDPATADVNDIPPGATTIPTVVTEISAVLDPNSIPTPGSLALFSMSLGLALRQLRQKN